MRKILLLSLLSWICVTADAQTYTVDPGHTAFTTRVLRFGVVPVLGRFQDVSGSLTYDENDLSKTKANINIKVASYKANNSGGEEAVTSQAFLDAASFPEISFSLGTLEQTADGLVASGTLKLHGVEKPIKCPVSVNGPLKDLPTGKPSVGISGKLVINRNDFGVGFDRKLPNGVEIIGSAVDIEFHILALAD